MPLVCLVEWLVQEGDREALALLRQVINRDDSVEVATILKLVEDLRCCEAAHRSAQEFIEKAKSSLIALPLGTSREALISLADEVLRMGSERLLLV